MPVREMPPPAEKSLGELFADLTRESSELVRQEVTLAKAEMTQKATRLGKDVAFIAAGGFVAYAGLLAVVAAIALLLVKAGLAPWLAALLTGVAVLLLGGVFVMQGINGLKKLDPIPQQTVESLKDDARWAKEQAK